MEVQIVTLTIVVAITLLTVVASQGSVSTKDNRFPYVVSLQDANRVHQCSAVLVGSRWIITAAQCVSPLVENSLGPHRFVISIGSSDLEASWKGETVPVQTIIHPQFDGNPQNGFDIALIYIREASLQLPLRTPQATMRQNEKDDLLNLAWGTNEDFSTDLRVIPTSSLSPKTCNSAEQGWNGGIKCGMMCTPDPSAGYCRGEPGSPLILADFPIDLSKGNPSFDILIGISSFGEVDCKENGKPAVFTRVSSFIEWINETVESIEPGERAKSKETDKGASNPQSKNKVNPQCTPPSISLPQKSAAETDNPPKQAPSPPATRPIAHRCISGCEQLNSELWKAVSVGDAAKTKSLLVQGADLNFLDRTDKTPLQNAAKVGHANVVKVLLDAGARVDVVDFKGDTALSEACFYGHADVVILLLNAGAQPDVQNRDENTPLITASGRGYTDIVRLLLYSGADMDIQNEDGDTALMVATDWGHADVVRLLLDAGASKTLRNNDRETALDIAKREKKIAEVSLLTSG